MPVFIPENPYENTKSPAEIEFFHELKQNLSIDDAYVFHSLKLPHHQEKIYGEADFIIVCSHGVLCLEVKGGNVAYKNGKWIYATNSGKTVDKDTDPFEQAEGNIVALRDVIKNTFKVQGSHAYGYGVVFPDIHFDISTVEYSPQLVYDLGTKNVTDYINGLYDFICSKDAKRYPLSPKQISDIVLALRRNFTFIETLSTRLEKNEKQIIRLTEQQTERLDSIMANKHIAIRGGAGTGKSVLAEEAAKRLAEENKKVLFIAYNKNIIRSISQNLSGYSNVNVLNIHTVFDKILPFSKEKFNELKSAYYSKYWPEQCCDILTAMSEEKKKKLQYDAVVMDEAQDILSPEYLFVIDLLLKGGLGSGKWIIFYDKEQNIYNHFLDEGLSLLEMYNILYYDLTINCRNTRNIASYNSSVTDTKLPKLLDNIEGEDIEIYGYENNAELKAKISELITLWNKEGVDKSNVVFLSPVRYENSDLLSAMGDNFNVNRLDDEYKPKANVPLYSTIHAFKGLDAPIIVLLDTDKIYYKRYKNLLYTAISRAKTKLYVIAKNSMLEKLKRS